MIDEQRVRQMTRIAIREKKIGYRIHNADGLGQREFVSYYGVRSFFSGTIFFIIACAVFLMVIFSVFTIPVTKMTLAVTLFGGILGYLFFLLFYLRYERRKNIARYSRYRQILNEQQDDMDRLAAMYDTDEKESHKDI